MSGAAQTPPEVKAALRALGRPQPTPKQTSSHPASLPPSPAVDDILKELLDADSVDIIGVFPYQCADRLIDLQAELLTRGEYTSPTMVRYFTPARGRVTLYRQTGVLGTLVRRWLIGITGLRNWLEPRTSEPRALDRLKVYEFDEMFLDCIIHVTKDGAESGITLSQLPTLPVSGHDSATMEMIIASRMSGEQVTELKTYLISMAAQAIPLTPQQIRCTLTHNRQPGGEFKPVIKRIARYGRLAQDDVEPIAVVAVCVNTARGPNVLLKRRTEKNSRDDFQTLSLISERILIQDLDNQSRASLEPNLERALDDLWKRAGQPKALEVPEASFRRAAQRELFMSCGLDVHHDRLKLTGTCVLDREEGFTHLGFFVYRLDLVRSSSTDELDDVRAWSPDLVLVPLDQLYSKTYGPRLNRLLRRKEDWLRQTVFASAPTDRQT
ncbi:hypothetical protein AB0C15_21285 [Micromonospora sp. NPDC048835]|uniref:hypothetical protein n=1 Tax=Micromonospora sp. NPDC048835 TaxID=3155147 RepID=UPI0033F8FBC0